MNSAHSGVSVSRRAAVTRLGAGGLGLALAARGFAAGAQEPTAEARTGDVPPLLTEWAAAWTAHDADQLLALYAEDGVYEEVPTNTVATGADEIRAYFEGTNATFSDIEATPEAGFRSEGRAALQGVFAGRYTGQLPDLPPGEGQAFSVRFAAVFELEKGKIRRSVDYFDLYSLLVQIGALPAPEGMGTPTAE